MFRKNLIRSSEIGNRPGDLGNLIVGGRGNEVHADRRRGLLEVRAAVAEGLAAGKRVGAEAAHEGEESEIGPQVRLCRAPA